MRLYFMRHAHAMDPQDWRGEEPARPLTDKGRSRAEAAAAGLATLRPSISVIISSPYTRAYETAVIVGRMLELPVETDDGLTPGFDLPRLDHALASRPDMDDALFVGHEPDLSHLITSLVTRDDAHSGGIEMKKASCCLLLTPSDLPGGASAREMAGRCTLGWLRDWRALAALRQEADRAK